MAEGVAGWPHVAFLSFSLQGRDLSRAPVTAVSRLRSPPKQQQGITRLWVRGVRQGAGSPVRGPPSLFTPSAAAGTDGRRAEADLEAWEHHHPPPQPQPPTPTTPLTVCQNAVLEAVAQQPLLVFSSQVGPLGGGEQQADAV